MKLKYSKKRYYLYLGIGLLWLTFFILRIIRESPLLTFDYVLLLLGITYFGYFLYLMNTPFLSITKGKIIRHRLINNDVIFLEDLSELMLDRSGNYYLISTKNKTILVKPSSIDSKSFKTFKQFIEKLNLDKKE